MFEFGRGVRRLFSGAARAPQDGVTGGDLSLLEFLDLRMLAAEAKAADVAAGRVGAKDRAQRLLHAAMIWREVARRSGDPASLRKAAATAEAAGKLFTANNRLQGWARSRIEQARCAMLGAELYGDESLNIAAEVTLGEARPHGGAAGALAGAALAVLAARKVLASGDEGAVRVAARRFNEPLALLEAAGRRNAMLKLAAVETRLARAEILAGCGLRLRDASLIDAALRDTDVAATALDAVYEPLTLARVETARAAAQASRAEVVGDIGALADAVSALADAQTNLARDQSPLDWARGQISLADALQTLGEAGFNEQAFEKAVTCLDRAMVVVRAIPALSLSATVASNRAQCLARSAELSGDLAVLDAAEAAFKSELSAGGHLRDPVAWALTQANLARLYETRLELTHQDRGERAAAALAYTEALEVFSDRGLRSLADLAARGLERLRDTAKKRV
jgi:hypothetical protein